MSGEDDDSSDFASFGAFNFSKDAVDLIEDYIRRMKQTQKAGSFAVLVEWADDRRSRNVEGTSWIAHGPGLCLHTVDSFSTPPEAAHFFENTVVAIKIPACIRERCREHSIHVDPWALPDPHDPKSPMPGMGTVGLVVL